MIVAGGFGECLGVLQRQLNGLWLIPLLLVQQIVSLVAANQPGWFLADRCGTDGVSPNRSGMRIQPSCNSSIESLALTKTTSRPIVASLSIDVISPPTGDLISGSFAAAFCAALSNSWNFS